MFNIDISFVIPAYNSQDTIESCIDGIYKQKHGLNIEVIVVDSSSGVEVYERVRKYQSLLYMRYENRIPPGVARNEGAKKARGEFIFFVDSDLLLGEGLIDKVWRICVNENVSILSIALDLPNDKDKINHFCEHLLFFHEYQPTRPREKRRNLSSTGFMIRRNIFLDNHGFEDFSRCEDVEFTERLSNKGYDLYFLPEVVGHRIQSIGIKKIVKKNFVFGNNLYFVRYQNKSFLFRLTFFILAPFLAIAKNLRIIFRNIRYHTSKKYLFFSIVLSPLILILGFAWMLGLHHAILTKRRIN